MGLKNEGKIFVPYEYRAAGAVVAKFALNDNLEAVLKLLQKHAEVPMSLADAGLRPDDENAVGVAPASH